jgi:hypothetical protein
MPTSEAGVQLQKNRSTRCDAAERVRRLMRAAALRVEGAGDGRGGTLVDVLLAGLVRESMKKAV